MLVDVGAQVVGAVDMERVQSLLEDARTTGESFSTMHRIIDANGFDRVVLIIGAAI